MKVWTENLAKGFRLALLPDKLGLTVTYPLDELKQMLHLKDPKGKEPELFQNICQFKARVLDIAVRQVSEHTDLKIDYQLLKKGRAYDAVRFTIGLG